MTSINAQLRAKLQTVQLPLNAKDRKAINTLLSKQHKTA